MMISTIQRVKYLDCIKIQGTLSKLFLNECNCVEYFLMHCFRKWAYEVKGHPKQFL